MLKGLCRVMGGMRVVRGLRCWDERMVAAKSERME